MRLGADRGLLDPDDKREPVRLNSLMSNVADSASEVVGDTLGGIWSFLSNPSEQKVADANARAEAIKQERLLGDEFGNRPNAWLYETEQSTNPNKVARFFENIPYNAAQLYLDSSRMAQVPEETIEPVGNLIAGGVLNLSGGLLDEEVGTEQREMANQFAGVVKDSFKDWDSISNMIANNPLDFMGALVGAGYTAKSIADLANNPAIKQSVRNTLQSLPDPVDLLANNKMTSQFIPDPRQFAMMWHGSPRNFTELDNKFMLTGEGNNVKGAGFYMGGRASTSKQYFGEIDKQNNTYDTTDFDLFQEEVVRRKREVDFGENKSEVVSHMWKEVRDNTATPSEVSWLLDKYKDHPDLPKLKKAIKDYKQLWSEQEFSLMKFDVQDEYVTTFLNDAKAVYDQPEAVKKLIRQEHGAYMDLVEAYKKNSGDRVEQNKILDEINTLGDFPHPESGVDLYDFFVDRRAEQFPSGDMRNHNLEVSKYLHQNGVMGRRWADDLSTKYPDLYDSENYLIFDAKTAEMFERNEVPVIPNPMIAQHNVREDALEKHLESSGIPMPSLAISRADNPTTNFGEITLLGSSDMITPSKDTVVYPTDMYSGRAPDDRVVYKDPEGVLDMVDPDKLRFFANVKPLDNPDELYTGGGISQMQGRTNREYVNDKARRKLNIKEHHTGLLERQIATVDEAIKRGFDPYKYPTYREAIYDINNTLHDQGLPLIKSISSEMIPREGLLGETVRTMTNPKGYRTPTGRKRPDVPYSAEQALKLMKKNKAYTTGAEGHVSFNQTYALSSTPFKDLQDIKDNRGILNDRKGMSEGDADELFEIDLERARKEISKISVYTSNELLDGVLRTGRIPKDDYKLYKIDADQAKQIEQIVLSLKDKKRKLVSDEWLKANPDFDEDGIMETSGLLTTDYFEAKPKKIIDIAEFKGAIIPKETKPKIIELLKQKGIKKILTYGTREERIALFKKFPELQFIGLAMPMGLLSGEEEQRKGLLL